jgi:hypothetical protein
MTDITKQIDKTVSQAVSDVTSPTFVRGLIHLLLALYAVRLAPELPKPIMDLFTNQYFRLFVFTLVLWTANYSPTTAIMISLAFMVSVNYATNKPLWEFLENIASEQELVEQAAEQPAAEAVVAVQQLADQAVSESATESTQVIAEAETAMAAVQTQEGATAVATLAEQAMTAEPADSQAVAESAQKAIADMVPAPESAPAPADEQELAQAPPTTEAATKMEAEVKMEGCYPVRQIDMSKVMPFDPSDL